MDIAAIIAAIQFAQSGIVTLVRAVERARQAGEVTEAQLTAVREAAKASDETVDAIIAAAKARRAGGEP